MKKRIVRSFEREEWCDYWSIQYNRGKYYPQVRWTHYTGEKDSYGKMKEDSRYDEHRDGYKTYKKAFDFIIKSIGEENL